MKFGYSGMSTEFLSCKKEFNYVADIHRIYISKFEKTTMRFGYSGMSTKFLSCKEQLNYAATIYRVYIS